MPLILFIIFYYYFLYSAYRLVYSFVFFTLTLTPCSLSLKTEMYPGIELPSQERSRVEISNLIGFSCFLLEVGFFFGDYIYSLLLTLPFLSFSFRLSTLLFPSLNLSGFSSKIL